MSLIMSNAIYQRREYETEWVHHKNPANLYKQLAANEAVYETWIC